MKTMEQILFPRREEWPALCCRPAQSVAALEDIVKKIFEDIAQNGDAAVLKYTRKYDCPNATELNVQTADFAGADSTMPDALRTAMTTAAKNIELFHASQKELTKRIETMPGVTCWRESRPIEKIGIYIPGGTAPLFSTVLMLAIPAKIAGCKEIILCTPPNREGKIDPAVLYAAKLTGVRSVFAVGGIQAIAAMTLGTESIPKADKIFGPGNQYVTAAKMYAQRYGTCIDLPAGPSEVLVIADKTAIPAFVAADLLSQAEHGTDSRATLLSDDEAIVAATLAEVKRQLALLPRKDIAAEVIGNSKAIVLPSIEDCISFSNEYAPEHLILATDNASNLAAQVTNAGSVFIGNYSCESAGDYATGTNHTLPTNGHARSYSGVSLDSFVKKITFQTVTTEGLKNIGSIVMVMAEAEGLAGHKEAVRIRLENKN